MRDNVNFIISMVIFIFFLGFMIGATVGEDSKQNEIEKILIKKNFAHYDEKTAEFIIH